jgi:hypothetical protein
MANIVPGVIWQPVDVSGRAARRKGRGLVGHVAVSSSKNLVPGPLATRSADWHFYLPKAGAAIQYIDLDLQCWATSAGNASLVAFESEGGLGTSAQLNSEPWTENQCQWAARILRHLHDTEGVPLQAMPDSKPTSRGFGTHRLGISPWRVAGGEVWSSANGKECPGNTKVSQVPHIIQLASGTGADDMDISELYNWRDSHGRNMGDFMGFATDVLADLTKKLDGLTKEVAALKTAGGSGGSVDVQAVADALTVVPKT